MGMAEENLLTTAVSIEGGTIRLTAERWRHITERHPELSGLRDEVMQGRLPIPLDSSTATPGSVWRYVRSNPAR